MTRYFLGAVCEVSGEEPTYHMVNADTDDEAAQKVLQQTGDAKTFVAIDAMLSSDNPGRHSEQYYLDLLEYEPTYEERLRVSKGGFAPGWRDAPKTQKAEMMRRAKRVATYSLYERE